MPNTVYDPDSDHRHHDDLGVHPEHREAEIDDLENQFAEPSAEEHTYGSGDSRPDLRSQEALKDPSIANGRHQAKQARDEAGAANKASAIPSTDLRAAEEDSGKLGRGYTGSGKDGGGASKLKNFKARFGSDEKFKKKVVIAGVATGGGMGILGVIIAIFFIVSLFKIPNLAQNIVEYQFARMSRQFADSAQASTEEALAVEGADDASYNGWKSAYENAKGTVQDTWGQLDKYRPGKVISNMKSDTNGLQFRYSQPNALGRQRLLGVTLDGTDYDIAQQGFTKYIPGINKMVNWKNQFQFASEFEPALTDSLRAQEVGPIIRGVVANRLRQELGINLYAWVLAKFKGKTGEAADVEGAREQAEAIDGEANQVPDNAVTDSVKQADQQVEQAAEQTIQNGPDSTIEAAIKNGGVLTQVSDALSKAVASSGLDTAIGVISPVYGPAIAICTVYDGSLERSGPTVDKQTTQQQASFYYLASAGDQEKSGDQTPTDWAELDSAVGSTNDALGDVSQSNAYLRASGQPVDTTKSVSAEASAGGEFTLLNATLGALGIPGAQGISDVINAVADKICPVATNKWAALGIGVGSLILGFLSGGATDAAETAAGDAADTIITTEAKSLIENLVTKYIGQTAGRVTGLLYDVGKQTVKSGLKIAAITLLAKLIVIMRSGQAFTGLSQGTDLANEADSGGNIHGNELERVQLFGRALTEAEVCQSNTADRAYVLAQASQQSTYQRYLSPSNSNSLLTHTATDIEGSMSGGIGNKIASFGTTLLQPYKSFGYLLGAFTGTSSAATQNCSADANDYGNTQFGYSEAEENLINNDTSYRPMENSVILDASGQEEAIAQKYAACFGYTYSQGAGDGSLNPTDTGGELTLADGPDGNGSLGTLFSAGDLIRDTHGNIDPAQGLCAPNNLGVNSPDSLAADNSADSKQKNDMIFRFRLAMRYDTTLSQLNDMQTVQ